MKSARQAFEATVAGLADVETIDAVLEIHKKIDEQIAKHQFAVTCGPYSIAVAEKLALDFEETGYYTQVGNPQMVNNEIQVSLYLNWKMKPAPNSRVDSSLADLDDDRR